MNIVKVDIFGGQAHLHGGGYCETYWVIYMVVDIVRRICIQAYHCEFCDRICPQRITSRALRGLGYIALRDVRGR